MDVFEAMETCRAMRYLEPRPVPDELVRKVVHAATRASKSASSFERTSSGTKAAENAFLAISMIADHGSS